MTETPIAQVDAAFNYLRENCANLASPVREINQFNLRKANLPPVVKISEREFKPAAGYQKIAKENFLQVMKRIFSGR
jgi:hypothetical protein